MGVKIIAEAGVNHNGDIKLAKLMVVEAYNAGCDAIKFQSFKAEELVLKDASLAAYQKENMTNSTNQYDMLKKLELNYDEFVELKLYCDEVGIQFMSTPFDFNSATQLNDLHMPIFKISSGDLNNMPFLRWIARFGKPIILSTGMCNLEDIEEALGWIERENNHQISILHCTTDYPTLPADVNLNAMLTIKNTFKYPVGYSDHTLGIEVPVAAVALGATIIEKHFTLDKNMEGPDHKASATVKELAYMVKCIRNIEIAMGSSDKSPTLRELQNKQIVRKSIVARETIEKDEIILETMLSVKRPGGGLEPKFWDDIVGLKALHRIEKDCVLTINDFTAMEVTNEKPIT